MKSIWKSLCGILVLGGLAASAQTTPKLALAGVSVTPTLAGKFASPTAAATSPSANVNVLGVWHAELVNPVAPAKPFGKWTVTIKQSTDGSLHGLFENNIRNYSCFSTSIINEGNHLKMTFYNDKVPFPNMNTVEGDVNPDFGIVQCVWSYHPSKDNNALANC